MMLSHLELAHLYWNSFVQTEDFVIDATCGKGRDSLALAKRTAGNLLCIDIQKVAIDQTKDYLKKNLPLAQFKKIIYHLGCHSSFPPLPEPPRLIVYNLGYLPGSDKQLVTGAQTTLKSLKEGLNVLKVGGIVGITCYSGHEEGQREEEAIIAFSKSLDKSCFRVCYQRWINRLKSPSIILIQKKFIIVNK